MPIESNDRTRIAAIAAANDEEWFLKHSWYAGNTASCVMSDNGFMIYSENEVFHLCSGTKDAPPIRVKTLHIEFVLVDKDHRRQGQCAQMLRYVMNHARTLGLEVSLESIGGKDLMWRKHGFLPYKMALGFFSSNLIFISGRPEGL